jgi:mycothiol synthase
LTDARVVITEGHLSPPAVAEVLSLAAAAQRADGVAPLSEDALLHIRHGQPGQRPSGDGTRDLVLTLPDGTLAGYAQLADAPAGAPDDDRSGELVVHPAHRGQGFGSVLAAAVTGGDGRGVKIWAHGDLPAAAALAKSAGFARVRSLWQMRLDLGDAGGGDAALPEPAYPAGVTVRTFRPGKDEQAWLEVNRRAFAHHPEQGSWTREDVDLREAEPWFDPDGFFLAERDGRLAGFHWTKVHPAEEAGGSPIGEVYVVGVDPAGQGGGLGRALTLTGLAYLRRRGLATVMLYVDESNTAAVRMYTALGFGRHSVDVMYRHP